jgi:hypothetical protein
MAEEGMADEWPPILGNATGEDLTIALGWHLHQGKLLSGTYAEAAKEAGDKVWEPVLRNLEDAYGAVLERIGAELPPEGTLVRRRPPF